MSDSDDNIEDALSYNERMDLLCKGFDENLIFLREKIEHHRNLSKEKNRTGKSIWHHESLESYYRSLLKIAVKEGPTCSKWIADYVVRAVK